MKPKQRGLYKQGPSARGVHRGRTSRIHWGARTLLDNSSWMQTFQNEGTRPAHALLPSHAQFFFDLRSVDTFSEDEGGTVLPDVAAAHRMALSALSDAARDAVIEGSHDQLLAVEVRDEIGPVLEVTAVFSSTIFRKQ